MGSKETNVTPEMREATQLRDKLEAQGKVLPHQGQHRQENVRPGTSTRT